MKLMTLIILFAVMSIGCTDRNNAAFAQVETTNEEIDLYGKALKFSEESSIFKDDKVICIIIDRKDGEVSKITFRTEKGINTYIEIGH